MNNCILEAIKKCSDNVNIDRLFKELELLQI